MSIKIKICGITNIDDALDALELGADYLGFNFYPDSPRYLPFNKASALFQEIPENIGKVGIFVNANVQKVIDIATELNLDFLQFHGDELPEYCNSFARPFIKSIHPQNTEDFKNLAQFEADYILIDAHVENSYGGTGVVSNWDLAREAKSYKPIFLSGGLNCDNIEIAIASVQPFAVDVASGVEQSPGKKDYRKMEEFIKKARRAGNMRIIK